jgi:DNA-binding NarL/FixJ family response regulator
MKILVADDHHLFRSGIRHLLDELGDGVEIVEAADHGSALERIATEANFSLALIDLHMPGSDGHQSLESLAKRFPTLPIVVLSACDDRDDMQRAFDCGALGFIPKSSSPAVMLNALRLVLAGGIYVPPIFLQSRTAALTTASSTPDLTPRQSEVLALILEGKPNKSIAAQLHLTEATVKAHVTAVFKALKVSTRTQAALAVSASKLRRS